MVSVCFSFNTCNSSLEYDMIFIYYIVQLRLSKLKANLLWVLSPCITFSGTQQHGSMSTIYVIRLNKDSYFIFVNAHYNNRIISFYIYFLESCIDINSYIPLSMGGNRISWSTPFLLFSCLTIHLCSLSIEFSGTVSQLNFMYVSVVFTVFPSWDFRILSLPFSFQYTLITSGKNFSRRQRYVPALWRFVSATEGRKMVGLGEKSESKLLPVGKCKIQKENY